MSRVDKGGRFTVGMIPGVGSFQKNGARISIKGSGGCYNVVLKHAALWVAAMLFSSKRPFGLLV